MYTSLALVVLAGLLGPLLASGRRLRVPVLVGELIGGIILGRTGLNLIITPRNPSPSLSRSDSPCTALLMPLMRPNWFSPPPPPRSRLPPAPSPRLNSF